MEKTRLLKMLQEPDPKYEEIQEYLIRSISYIFLKKKKKKSTPAKSLQSCLFATLWTIAPRAPLSIGFSRQEYWSGLPCPPPEGKKNLCTSII